MEEKWRNQKKGFIEWAESGGEMEKSTERIHRIGRIWRRNGEINRKDS